jgi:hypothetical protein
VNDDRVRDLMKGFGDPVVPAPDGDVSERARTRALPRIEASLRAVAATNARRSRTRKVALLAGIAAMLAIGIASAAVLSHAAFSPSPSPSAPASIEAPSVAVGVAPARVAPPSAPAEPSSNATEAPNQDEPPIASSSPSAPNVVGPRVAKQPDHKASSPPEVSTLSDQNRLLSSALEARKRGDDARALGSLNELLQKYPSSPLAQEARVERLRCLERLGQKNAAADEARRYLTDYPDGFAREEAKGQALPAPSAPKSKP